VVRYADKSEQSEIPVDKRAGIRPMTWFLAPRFLRNSWRNVDSTMRGSPKPHSTSTAEIPKVFLAK